VRANGLHKRAGGPEHNKGFREELPRGGGKRSRGEKITMEKKKAFHCFSLTYHKKKKKKASIRGLVIWVHRRIFLHNRPKHPIRWRGIFNRGEHARSDNEVNTQRPLSCNVVTVLGGPSSTIFSKLPPLVNGARTMGFTLFCRQCKWSPSSSTV